MRYLHEKKIYRVGLVDWLKLETLSSNPTAAKKKKKKRFTVLNE
jgi:hypothetical protein